ncbi:STAS domain-containing protein [Lentzea sp. NPDC060358]|uniref:STAS domain-containing protein n=1 Tax=Lentzea sp. NPDC060358 TaxID=3347103 RepID=UPI0036569C43
MTEPRPLPIWVGTADSGFGTPITSVHGEIDLTTGHVLRDEVATRLADRPRSLVLDVSRVTFLGSAGINVMLRVGEQAAEREVAFAVVTGEGFVRRVLTLSGVSGLLGLYRDLPAALAAVG